MKRQTKHKVLPIRFFALSLVYSSLYFAFLQANAQVKQLIQMRTFDEQLQPMKNVGVSINGKEHIFTSDKGVAFVELGEHELPVKSISVKDEQFEVKAWNYSKSILEIVVRKKSYQLAHITVKDQNGRPVEDLPITFRGKKITNGNTNREGKLEILLALDEKISSASQFAVQDYEIVGLQTSNGQSVLTVAQIKPVLSVQEETATNKAVVKDRITDEEYLRNFDFSKIDSIQSLTMFYAIFKNYEISSLDEGIRKRIDAKFNQLMSKMQDSVHQGNSSFLGRISDSSYVDEDIRNLLKQATAENLTLLFQRDQFDEKIKIIDFKLEKGMVNLDADARAALLADLLELERLLKENESRFYKNMNYYRDIINSLKEKYFDFQNLENKLSESEARLLEEQRIFRQRLIAISAIVLIFAVLILLLIKFSNRLNKQKRALQLAHEEVKRINENLEGIVSDRTKMLEESNRELDTFLYRASHDLRSPVCSIKGLCNIAASLSEGEPRELVQQVVITTEKMDKLLTKLNIISEINHPTEYSSIAFRTMAENVLGNFIDIIDQKKIEFHIDCQEDILFYSHPRLVEVVLFNLVENALYYGAMKNSGNIRVELTAKKINDKIEFSVQDYGIGINESIRDRLFDMFFKGHEASKGNGLGLYIVQKSVTALKGTITVESEKGKYTRFIVQLPIKTKPVNEALIVA